MSRKSYNQMMAEINTEYLRIKCQLIKANASNDKLEQLNRIRRKLQEKCAAVYMDDLYRLNNNEKIKFGT